MQGEDQFINLKFNIVEREELMSGRTHSKEFKAKVALEIIKGEKTLNELASMYELHPSLMREWKNILVSGASSLFEGKQKNKEEQQQEALPSRLYQEIGQLKVELDWLKKKSQLFL